MVDNLIDRLDNARDQLTNLGIGILQLVIVFLLAMLVAHWLRGRLRRRLKSAPSPVLAVMAENAAVVGVYVVAITIVLAFWGMTWTGLLTALSIGTVAAAFGFQDLLRSLVGGTLILFERPFAPGDRIKIREVEGRVEQIDLRTTVIRADNGDRVVVPNALIFSDPVVNRSPNRGSRTVTVAGVDGTPAELKRRVKDALNGVLGLDGPPVVTVRTRKTRTRVRKALNALPGNNHDDHHAEGEARGVGLRVMWSGDRSPATTNEVKRRLQEALPGANISF
jgi:small-conductance mechanosensitive channel